MLSLAIDRAQDWDELNLTGTDIVFEKYDWSSVKSKPNSDRVSTVHDTLLEYWIDSRQYIYSAHIFLLS